MRGQYRELAGWIVTLAVVLLVAWSFIGSIDAEERCADGGGTWIVSTAKYDEGGRCLRP